MWEVKGNSLARNAPARLCNSLTIASPPCLDFPWNRVIACLPDRYAAASVPSRPHPYNHQFYLRVRLSIDSPRHNYLFNFPNADWSRATKTKYSWNHGQYLSCAVAAPAFHNYFSLDFIRKVWTLVEHFKTEINNKLFSKIKTE